MQIFERLESEVRGYCRSFPRVFARASGATVWDESGKEYLDFFAGAGALNYGHDDPQLRQALIDYLTTGGLVHSLDMATPAKRAFLEQFEQVILEPRGLNYKMQFPGPTGTNAVEAALKLARKVTGRHTVVSFTNGFHGMTLGSLAVTGNATKRAGAGVPLGHARSMPFEGYLPGVDSIDVLTAYLDDAGSGLDKPAAVILETVQAEGGVKPASTEWLSRLAALLRARNILLIVDDIQVGCGRTGPFFSFEDAAIEPDIVCLSKSLSGFGLPFALVLMRPELDVWEPGEHNGTFRGHNLAFVTATAALRYWHDDAISQAVTTKSDAAVARLGDIVAKHPEAQGTVRGRGLILGVDFADRALAGRVAQHAFARGLIIETAGIDDQVLKLLPPLTIATAQLERGLEIIEQSVIAALDEDAGELPTQQVAS